jgi:hypothetical protein
MPNRLGPLEVTCDAPPYNIVRACHMIGMRSPEDVRWSRHSQFVNPNGGHRDELKHPSWRALLGMGQRQEGCCSCDRKLPIMERYTFTLISGSQSSYFIGQCSRCLAIYWDEA